jgi:hypothetical protein
MRAMESLFAPLFLIGAGALALWIDLRFPQLAPQELRTRMLAVVGAVVVLVAAPLVNSSPTAAFATLFALVLPAFVFAFLTAVWLLRALAGGVPRH